MPGGVAGGTPVPVKLIDCGLPAALSVMLMEAFLVPVAVVVNVTLIGQFAPAATLVPQVLVWAKSAGFAPPRAMPEMLSAALPLLVRVTVCAALVESMFWELKVRLEADKLTAGSEGGGGDDPAPPQAAQVTINNSVVPGATHAVRRRDAARRGDRPSTKSQTASQGRRGSRRSSGTCVSGWERGAKEVLAVVVTVTVAFTGPEPVDEMEVGDGVHVAPAGAPEQAMDTVPLKPLTGTSSKVNVAVWPAVMLAEVSEDDNSKSGVEEGRVLR